VDTLWKDIRYGVRGLLKQPAFTIVAVLTLSLGIGANTAIFSVVNTLVLNPPLFQEPDNIVAVWKTPTDEQIEGFVSFPDLQDWRTRTHSFEELAAYKPHGFNVTSNDEVERLPGLRVTANFLPLMKFNPIRGRNFFEEEERRGSALVAILSYELWQSKFGGSEAALQQQIVLDGKPHAIVGILPSNFTFPFSTKGEQVLTTVIGEGSNLPERGAQVFRIIGRVKPEIGLEAAQTELGTVAANLAQEYPATNRNTTAFLVGAHQQIVGPDVRWALWLLLGAVVFILLIACTNTANLLLVRITARQREIAVRAALGAGRWRLVRQMFTESLLLSLISAIAGLLIAMWGLGAIRYYAADQLPRIAEVQIDGRVLLFTLVVSVITGLLFSLVPTLKASQADVNEVLKSGSKAATSSRTLRLWRDSLVVLEVSLSLILLVGAGLMIKSFSQLVNVPPGFDAHNVLTGQISLTRAIYNNPEESLRYVDQTLERLRSLPGVENAAFAGPMPFSGGNVGSDFRIEGRPKPDEGDEPFANNRSVSNDYFRSMRIPLLKGRFFNEQDKRNGPGVAIVNQTFVQLYFPNEEPLGKRLSNIGANQNEGDPAQWEIVGVVGDVHHNSLTKAANPELYLPHQQNSWGWGNFFIRTTTAPESLAGSFRNEIKAIDKTVPLTDVRPLTQAISLTVNEPRFYTFLFGLFGLIGLVLTVTGVYGLVSYTVSQRTQEIGIRLALGATRQNVMRMVIKQGIALALIGIVIGVAVSLTLTRLIVTLLFEVKPTDPGIFTFSSLVLLAAALLACFVPARRATRVDPIDALRYE
jgi:putative ABC transport system permease protein